MLVVACSVISGVVFLLFDTVKNFVVEKEALIGPFNSKHQKVGISCCAMVLHSFLIDSRGREHVVIETPEALLFGCRY